MLSDIMMNVIKLRDVILNVVLVIVIMLIVMHM